MISPQPKFESRVRGLVAVATQLAAAPAEHVAVRFDAGHGCD